MSPWLIFGGLSALFWATSDVLVRIVSDKISPAIASLFLALGMIIFMTIFYMLSPSESIRELTISQWKFVAIVFGAGIFNTFAHYSFLHFFKNQGNFTEGMPVILLMIVLFTTLSGVFFFKDPFTLKIGIGIFFATIAIYLLAS